MPFKKTEVLYAICDSCGEKDIDYDTGVSLLFDSPEQFSEHHQTLATDDEATEGEFYSWTIADGVLTCATCRAKAHCREHGHTPVATRYLATSDDHTCLVCDEILGPRRNADTEGGES